jgi:hypothetical protein
MNREDDGGRDGLGIPLTAAIHCEPDIQTTNREDEYLTNSELLCTAIHAEVRLNRETATGLAGFGLATFQSHRPLAPAPHSQRIAAVSRS